MSTKKSWRKIASADDDVIASELLDWSRLTERWQNHDMDKFYDFMSDVAEHCRHIEIDRDEWDADSPGRSGTWHVVRTNSSKELRKELADRVSKLIRESDDKRTQLRAKENARAKAELKGPRQSQLVCEASIWDDIFPHNLQIPHRRTGQPCCQLSHMGRSQW